MPKPHLPTLVDVASFANLHRAALAAARGKRASPSVARYMLALEPNLLRLQRRLLAGQWASGGYATFTVKDPKPRQISAAPFADRVLHHALCQVCNPIFERSFIDDSFANRQGFGTHRAVARYEQFRDRYSHVLRADI